MTTSRIAFGLSGLSGAAAVIIGAATAHLDLAASIPRAPDWIDTALTYQMWHAAALLAVAAGIAVRPGPAMTIAVVAFAVGTLLFCGSLYLLAFGAPGFVASITPFGGSAFIVGWLALVWHGVAPHKPKTPGR